MLSMKEYIMNIESVIIKPVFNSSLLNSFDCWSLSNKFHIGSLYIKVVNSTQVEVNGNTLNADDLNIYYLFYLASNRCFNSIEELSTFRVLLGQFNSLFLTTSLLATPPLILKKYNEMLGGLLYKTTSSVILYRDGALSVVFSSYNKFVLATKCPIERIPYLAAVLLNHTVLNTRGVDITWQE